MFPNTPSGPKAQFPSSRSWPPLPSALECRTYTHGQQFAKNWRVILPKDARASISVQSTEASQTGTTWTSALCSGATAHLWKAAGRGGDLRIAQTVIAEISESLPSGSWIAADVGSLDGLLGRALSVSFWASPSVPAVGKLYFAIYQPGRKGNFDLNSCFNICSGGSAYRLTATMPKRKPGEVDEAASLELWFPLGTAPVRWEYRFDQLQVADP